MNINIFFCDVSFELLQCGRHIYEIPTHCFHIVMMKVNYLSIVLLKTRWVSGKRQYLVQWKDNSPSSWQYENDVSESLKTAFHTAKARKKRRKRKY
jgi:hypothetical protein